MDLVIIILIDELIKKLRKKEKIIKAIVLIYMIKTN